MTSPRWSRSGCGRRSGGSRKQGGPHLPEGTCGPPYAVTIRSRRIDFSVLLPSAAAGLSQAGGPPELRLRFPDGLRAIRFIHCERCRSAESRTGPLHSTPRRRCGVDETRDWFRRRPTRRDQLASGERQYRKRVTRAQEGGFLSPRVNIANISTRSASARRRDQRAGAGDPPRQRGGRLESPPDRPHAETNSARRASSPATGKTAVVLEEPAPSS